MSVPMSESLQAKMELAIVDLERKLRAADRVMIGRPRWVPVQGDPTHMELAVDSVPVNVVKLLGKERVAELYAQELRAMDPEDRQGRQS